MAHCEISEDTEMRIKNLGRSQAVRSLATKWLQPDETNVPRPTSTQCRQPILLRLFTIFGTNRSDRRILLYPSASSLWASRQITTTQWPPSLPRRVKILQWHLVFLITELLPPYEMSPDLFIYVFLAGYFKQSFNKGVRDEWRWMYTRYYLRLTNPQGSPDEQR